MIFLSASLQPPRLVQGKTNLFNVASKLKQKQGSAAM